jgi:hypothetical protein
MKHPALKGEVSINKMLTQRNPRLRRSNVVSNGFGGCVADATKEFSGTPEMSFSEIVSQPGMLLQKRESTIPFEKLKSLADTHGWRNLYKQMDMVNSDVKFIDFTALPVSNLSQEKFNVHSHAIKLHRVPGVLAFPHEVESILSKAMLSGFQIHFSSPEHSSHYIRLFNSGGLVSRPSDSTQLEILNLEDGDSSQNLKVWVSSPWM